MYSPCKTIRIMCVTLNPLLYGGKLWRGFLFGELAILRTINNLKPAYIIFSHTIALRGSARNRQNECILMTDSPNLMLAKVSRYTVCHACMSLHPLSLHACIPYQRCS